MPSAPRVPCDCSNDIATTRAAEHDNKAPHRNRHASSTRLRIKGLSARPWRWPTYSGRTGFQATTLSWKLPWFWRAQLLPLPTPVDPGPSTHPVPPLLDVSGRVQHSPPDGHSDLLPFPLRLSGVDTLRHVSIPNFRNSERTCLRSGRTPRRSSLHSSVLPRQTRVFSMSSPSPINNWSFNHNRSSRTPLHSKSSTCTQKRMSRVSC